jgi:hypothetical protein
MRERDREREKRRDREKEGGREREIERYRDVKYGCFIFIFFKGMIGALAPFSYLVISIVINLCIWANSRYRYSLDEIKH